LKAPAEYVAWINAHIGFNPRAQQNSDALSDYVLADLREACPALDRALTDGRLTARKNREVYTRVANRNVDLVLFEGERANSFPGSVLASVENKTIMAAHGKARKNRYGDLIAYSNHMHNNRSDCVAGCLLVINRSPNYRNPDAFASGLVRAKFDMEKVVSDTVRLFANIPLRNPPEDPNDQPEAIGLIIVDYDGSSLAKLVTKPPAPQAGDSTNYDSFIRRFAELYSSRFSALS
jgi:hypothetical protein